MYVGALQVQIRILEAFSLKDKRRVLKSVCEKTSRKYDFSCAEVGDLELINLASLGFSCVSNSFSHVDDRLNTLIEYLDNDYRFEIVNIGRDIINVVD
ncbi:MAG: DUF503 domain-containing protein [Bacillota bacterium]|nr:DUF503 domain-containing protein [Bacillota bacterium]